MVYEAVNIHTLQSYITIRNISVITSADRDAMTSFKGGMQDRNVGPLLPDMCVCMRACVRVFDV